MIYPCFHNIILMKEKDMFLIELQEEKVLLDFYCVILFKFCFLIKLCLLGKILIFNLGD